MKVVKYAVDITAQKARNADFEGKVAAIDRSQAVIEFDMGGKVLTVNENFLGLLGYRADEVIGKHHRMFVPEDEAQTSAISSSGRSSDAASSTGRVPKVGKSGQEVWIQATYNPVMDADGNPVKVVKFAIDVTGQKLRNAEYQARSRPWAGRRR